MSATAPVANVGRFTSAGDLATIVLKSGNVGGTSSGTRWDSLEARDASAAIIIESRGGGRNHAWYREEGTWADISATSGAAGVTGGLGSRYGSTARSVAGLKAAVFEPVIASSGQYRVYATWPAHASARNPILYQVTHADGVAEIDVDQNQNADTWFELGEYRFMVGGSAAVRLSNEHIDESGSMFASAVRFVQVGTAPEYSRADFDHDGDVDLDDLGHLQLCLSGTGVGQDAEACVNARLDDDNDVDSADVVLFRPCLSGADLDADVYCP
jgi:hypothetical protein